MVQSPELHNDICVNIPITQIEEIIIQETASSRPSQHGSALSTSNMSMFISFHLNDSSQLLINGKESPVSLLQLHFEKEDDLTELHDRIAECQRMASQGRLSVSQMIEVSREQGPSIPSTLAESAESQVLESHFFNPGSLLQNGVEDVHEGIHRAANSVSPNEAHESASLIDDSLGTPSAKITLDKAIGKRQKSSSVKKQTPAQTVARRRSPRLAKPSSGTLEHPISYSPNVAQARSEETQTLPKGTLNAAAPNRYTNASSPPETPFPTTETDMVPKVKTSAAAHSAKVSTSSNSLNHHVRRSPRLAEKTSRIPNRVNETKSPPAASPLERIQAPEARISGRRRKDFKAKQPLILKSTDAIASSKIIPQQNQKAQAVGNKKPANGRVTKVYATKGNLHKSAQQGENEVNYHDDPDLWKIPSDEPKNKATNVAKSTKKRGHDKTVKSLSTKIDKAKPSRQKVGTAGDQKGADTSNKAQSSDCLQKDDTDGYFPSQLLPQVSHLTSTGSSNKPTRVLRSSVRKANSRHNSPVTFHELDHRTPIRRKSLKKPAFPANQKIARAPRKAALIEAEALAATDECPPHNSDQAPTEKVSAAAKAVPGPKPPEPMDGHEASAAHMKSKDSEMPDVTGNCFTNHTDGAGSNNHCAEVSRLLVDYYKNVPQTPAIPVTDDGTLALSKNQPFQESLGLLSSLRVLDNKSRSSPQNLTKEDIDLSIKAGNGVSHAISSKTLPLQRSCSNDTTANALCPQDNLTNRTQSADITSNEHPIILAEAFQEYFKSATAFNDLGGSEDSTRERTPPRVPANTLVEEKEIREPLPQKLSPTSDSSKNYPETPQQHTKDSFAVKVAGVLRDVSSIRRNETSRFSGNAEQHVMSPRGSPKIAEKAQSLPVSKDTVSQIGDLPLPPAMAEPVLPIVATATPVNSQSDLDCGTLRDTSGGSVVVHVLPHQKNSTGKSPNQLHSPQKLDPKSPFIGLIDSRKRTKTFGHEETLESTSNEGSSSDERKRTSTTLPRSKRKANEKAEGDIKRLRMSPSERVTYVTPRKKLASDVLRGGSTTSPLTDERHYRKPTIITFSGNGPRNQGKKITPNVLPKPQSECDPQLTGLLPPSSGKRKRHEEGDQQDQVALQDSRKRLRHLQFSLPSTNKKSFSLVDMPSSNSPEYEKLNGSQSTRVTSEGSPIAAKQRLYHNRGVTLIPRIISESIDREGEDVDRKPSTKTGWPGSEMGGFSEPIVKLPDLPNQPLGHPRQRRVKSGYGKLLPSTPTAPSRMLTNLAAHTVEPDGRFYNLQTQCLLCESEIPDPFAGPKTLGSHTEKAQVPNANTFLKRLRKSMTIMQKPANPGNGVDEHATKPQDDPDKILVEMEEQGRGRVARPQGSPDSSHSSSSSSTKSRRRSPSKSDGPGDSPRTLDRKKWKATLKPHQAETRRILEEMSDVGGHKPFRTHELISFLSTWYEILSIERRQ